MSDPLKSIDDVAAAEAAAVRTAAAKTAAIKDAAAAKAAAADAEDSAAKAMKAAEAAKIAVPNGYRQGIITAITIFITFALAFLRFWAFEEKSGWTRLSVFAAGIIGSATVALCYTLYRAIKIADENPKKYGITVRWLLGSMIGLIVGVLVAAVVFSGIFAQKDEDQSQSVIINAQSVAITTNAIQ